MDQDATWCEVGLGPVFSHQNSGVITLSGLQNIVGLGKMAVFDKYLAFFHQ